MLSRFIDTFPLLFQGTGTGEGNVTCLATQRLSGLHDQENESCVRLRGTRRFLAKLGFPLRVSLATQAKMAATRLNDTVQPV